MTGPIEPAAHERGAALLTVLILVSVLGALAVVVFDRLRLATMLASNHAGIEDARSFSAIAEALVAMKIEDLVTASPGRTTLVGGWQGRATVIPLPSGSAEIRVRDGANCFNLNSLVMDSRDARASRPPAIDQLARLMMVLDVPDSEARRIAAATADWIDSDGDANPEGAEDSVYARGSPAYRTGNTLMTDASEWRAVTGVTPALYARLRPLLCALPVAEISPLNVNTLTPDQAPLLAMLFPGTLSVAAARRVIAARPAAGWGEMASFWNTPALQGVVPSGEGRRQPGVQTSWFAVDMQILAGDGELRETALFDARQSPVKLARRRWTADE
ncbi:type II secretion system minor pseudopilin GspK [Polymorphobacter fuscus]|uniref:Type II secretion system protein K n=1 Tax=Sandarakinorhabdus fusca TaxID=1439888 RepID=A0A7C9GU65_9SPHN|nr:type II secretion system minor pseudopilin GspK [Polymorphobacter fuscus]KAB7648992.1 general secretion pathway protein GspK [Polymorphobacter fuscus]MQT16589.1 general secretion pathway protein GspK [Polymorphobacter fuscus]NJC07121.1 general secretion pathway protein K [Polymorphobacter fuscus]